LAEAAKGGVGCDVGRGGKEGSAVGCDGKPDCAACTTGSSNATANRTQTTPTTRAGLPLDL
jgi:hypothetical protein